MKANKMFLAAASFALIASMATPTFAATGSRHITNDMVKNGMLQETVNVGGGVWDYGTCLDGFQKSVGQIICITKIVIVPLLA